MLTQHYEVVVRLTVVSPEGERATALQPGGM